MCGIADGYEVWLEGRNNLAPLPLIPVSAREGPVKTVISAEVADAEH